MRLIGIDAGSKGVICEIDTMQKTCRYMKLPFREDKILDANLIQSEFYFDKADYIYCEQVHGMKPWGVSNNFRFGGIYWMVLLMLRHYPYQLVTPQAWQKLAHKGMERKAGEAKKRSMAAFRRLNPNSGIKDPDLIDAYFVARYAGYENNVMIPNDLNFICVGS